MSFIARRAFSTTVRRLSSDAAVKEAKRGPELMILGGAAVAALGAAGYYYGTAPASSAAASNPWEHNAEGVDPKDAPSAVNVVIVPNVNLPKNLHDKYNKWGKDGY